MSLLICTFASIWNYSMSAYWITMQALFDFIVKKKWFANYTNGT